MKNTGFRRAVTSAATPLGFLMLVGLSGAVGVQAQEVDRNSYINQLPLSAPRLGTASAASVALNLFGDANDPGYRDVAPIDGIDDARHAVLESLAVRFAPFLIQNTSDFPTDFRQYVRNREVFSIFVDTWELSADEPELRRMTEINWSVLGQVECSQSLPAGNLEARPEATREAELEDCKIQELLGQVLPDSSRVRPMIRDRVRQLPNEFDVLFLNFPGEGEGSWEEAYRPEYNRTPEADRPSFPHSFVHPFVLEVEGGFELLFQYWFFYPTNDSGMDHEGDWEHVNVVVSPMSMVEGALDRATLLRILDGGIAAAADEGDPLVIKRVDYYFHDLVMPLDFSKPNVYLPRDEWEAQADAIVQERFREREIWEQLRYMAWEDDAETVVNTHPFGHIGSDNKGLNQIMEAPGGSNRNSHGTFPLAGRYNNVGPGGTTDQIATHLDTRAYLRRLREGRESIGPDFRRGSVIGLGRPERLTILPDWERLVDLVRTDATVRADWAWMLLPLHWGYPATKSPFAGVLEHYNTGNVAPVGPSFSTGWNRSGPTSSFKLYEPHTIASIFPLQLQDNFRNDLGFLNLTVPTLLNLPPFDFLSRIVAYPFRLALDRPDPVYYPREGLPFRFVGLSTGISSQRFDRDFGSLVLNPTQFDQFLGSLFGHLLINATADETVVVESTDFMERATGTFLQVPFYIGERLSSENTVRNSRVRFGGGLQFNNIPDYSYGADLNYWEYAGSFRYSLSSSTFQPYLKAGYGWSWYRIENTRFNGVLAEIPRSEWIKPGIMPNVRHFGAGIEWIPLRGFGDLPGGLDLSMRIEYARYSQALGLDLSQVPLGELRFLYPTLADVPGGDRVLRQDFLIGFTLSF